MTPQEAKEALKIEQIQIEGKAVRVAKFFEGISVANEALEKQIPKKPSETDKARCICCACVVKRDERFCKNCGQALDWSDTE